MRGRPWEVVAALAAVGVVWVLFIGRALSGLGGEDDPNITFFYVVGWTAALLVWSWRVWEGGSAAIRYLKMMLVLPGTVFLVYALWQSLSALRDGGSGTETERLLEASGFATPDPRPLDHLLPALAAAVLVAVGLLLHRGTVRRWVRKRGGDRAVRE
ncbi:hypothetical protein [Actinomadura sp. WAC 06369]|uniref:hypothetical protein n=1 Tax=Actinomadura sp. WAC 06369 TaxID=2203193 RepID=UPI000F7A2535|nr:hypothetical protein [Actinomadura sp. WAC 06369]